MKRAIHAGSDKQLARVAAKQWGVVLKDETADVEGVFVRVPVYVIAADVVVLVEDQNSVVLLIQQDRRRYETAHAGA